MNFKFQFNIQMHKVKFSIFLLSLVFSFVLTNCKKSPSSDPKPMTINGPTSTTSAKSTNQWNYKGVKYSAAFPVNLSFDSLGIHATSISTSIDINFPSKPISSGTYKIVAAGSKVSDGQINMDFVDSKNSLEYWSSINSGTAEIINNGKIISITFTDVTLSPANGGSGNSIVLSGNLTTN